VDGPSRHVDGRRRTAHGMARFVTPVANGTAGGAGEDAAR